MMSFKQFVLKVTPNFAHVLLRDLFFGVRMMPNYIYDFKRYLKYSGLNKSRKYPAERAARIVLFYHQVEKGLSLAAPRPGFGMRVIPRLLNDIDRYIAEFGIQAPATTALAALGAYVRFHENISQPNEYVAKERARIIQKYGITPDIESSWSGGSLSVSKLDIEVQKSQGFKGFFESRHSVRNFTGNAIPVTLLTQAVEIAQKTPSVCNRQSWRVHLFRDQTKIKELLEIQSGSRGFGENASAVMVVTSDLGYFVDVGERYQAWIDGGMFSMSLCLALHDQGLGSCCLNWSKEMATDKKMREAANIPGQDQIIMLIAIGGLPDNFDVAYSYRPPVTHCLIDHG